MGYARPSPSQAIVVDPVTLDSGDAEAWDRLSDRAADANPFLRRAFVQATARNIDRTIKLLVVAEGDRWLALLPVRRAPSFRLVRATLLAPWFAENAMMATPLLDAERLDEAAEGLAGAICGERRAAALVLHPIDPSDRTAEALGKALEARRRRMHPLEEFERAYVSRRPEPTYLNESMSGKSRKKLRASARALEKEAGGPVEAVDVTADPAAPATFMAIEERGWKGKAGGALASTPSTQRWFEEMCAGMAAAGKLQLLALRAADETVAVQQNLIDGGLIYALKTTYDESYARFSPGALLEAKSIEVFHERADLVAMDSCAQPGAELFERIWPDRRRLQKVIVPTGAWYASLVVRAIRAERRLAKAWRRIRAVERGALAE